MHRHLITSALCVAMLVAAPAAQADDRVRLQDDPILENGLRVIAIADFLRKNCDAIAPRFFKALSFAQSLEAHAKGLGYSDAEIEAYLDDEREKARVRGHARAYLEARGVNFDEAQSFCSVGRAEIAVQSAPGQYLRIR